MDLFIKSLEPLFEGTEQFTHEDGTVDSWELKRMLSENLEKEEAREDFANRNPDWSEDEVDAHINIIFKNHWRDD